MQETLLSTENKSSDLQTDIFSLEHKSTKLASKILQIVTSMKEIHFKVSYGRYN